VGNPLFFIRSGLKPGILSCRSRSNRAPWLAFDKCRVTYWLIPVIVFSLVEVAFFFSVLLLVNFFLTPARDSPYFLLYGKTPRKKKS